MLTASSNQAAVILADNSGLDRKTFVSFMNDKAKNFGLKKTILKDVSGLDPNNISTAKEMAMIGYQAFLKSKIIEGTNFINYTFAVTDKDGKLRNVNVKNRNYSLLAYQPQASKTGFLVEAQRNAVVKKNDQIVVILHALSMSQRNQILSKLLGEPIKLSRR
jgi:D-alanyl-D-alanine endopeptidase (penicillin-binding protein 7)